MKFGITAKITTALVAIVIVVSAMLTYATIKQTESLSDEVFDKIVSNLITGQGMTMAKTFDASIESYEHVTNPERMQAMVERNLEYHGRDLLSQIYINAPDDTSKNGYRVIAGTGSATGEDAEPEDLDVIKANKVIIVPEVEDGLEVLDVKVPLHVDGKPVATASIEMSTAKIEAAQAKIMAEKKAEVIQGYLLYTLMAILFSIIVGYLVSRKLTAAIRLFTDIAEKLSMGDLDVDPRIKSNDEVGKLSEAFERMVTSVKFFMTPEEEASADEPVSKCS